MTIRSLKIRSNHVIVIVYGKAGADIAKELLPMFRKIRRKIKAKGQEFSYFITTKDKSTGREDMRIKNMNLYKKTAHEQLPHAPDIRPKRIPS